MTLSVQAAQNNLYVGGGWGGKGRADILGQVELSKDYYMRGATLPRIQSWLYLVASSHAGMDRIDNCCKYNATNWCRMSVSKKTKNVCFVLFRVPAS